MKDRVCPVWVGYFLASPLRKLIHNPLRIVGPHVRPGMKVADIGSAMGFFSLPLARLVGENGRVICVDLQEKMLQALTARARRAGLTERIETRKCGAESLGLDDLLGQMDFVLAFAVVHEAPEPARFITEIAGLLKAGGRALIVEPKGQVSRDEFRKTVMIACKAGLWMVDSPRIAITRSVLMEKA